MYITFEGPEACGKSTQAKLLAEHLESEGHSVFLTKEPGSPSDKVCQKIRGLLLDPENDISHKTAFFLFLADRAQHMIKVGEALDEKRIVISDRSSLSTLVYYLAGIEIPDIKPWLNFLSPSLSLAQGLDRPDLCFACTADLDWCEKQLNERPGRDRIEQFDVGFHKRVHNLFAQYCSLNSSQNDEGDRLSDFKPRIVLATPSASSSSTEEIHDFIKTEVAILRSES